MSKTLDVNVQIKKIILEMIPDLDESELLEDSDIFELGLDSINAMVLVLNLQESFSIKFDAGEINVENFHSISEMSSLIESKL